MRKLAGSKDYPLCLVAYKEGLPVGTVSLTKRDMSTRLELFPWLAGLYVKADHRGHAIGKTLSERILVEARRAGFERVYLFTHLVKCKDHHFKVEGTEVTSPLPGPFPSCREYFAYSLCPYA
jgi:predicted N-acetyltransferase YhbS